jgi:hypothetical protein
VTPALSFIDVLVLVAARVTCEFRQRWIAAWQGNSKSIPSDLVDFARLGAGDRKETVEGMASVTQGMTGVFEYSDMFDSLTFHISNEIEESQIFRWSSDHGMTLLLAPWPTFTSCTLTPDTPHSLNRSGPSVQARPSSAVWIGIGGSFAAILIGICALMVVL